MSVRRVLGRVYRDAFDRLGIAPMQRVLAELRRRHVWLADLDALEVFGGVGSLHTRYFASQVKSLQMWEIDPDSAALLKRNLPFAEVKVTDSFQEIKRTTTKFDLISIDNSPSGGPGHPEHFDLFPHVFRVAKNSAILIFNVMPTLSDWQMRMYPYIHDKELQFECRKRFYGTVRPEKVTHDQMVATYERLARASGFDLDWHFFQRINGLFWYLVISIRRRAEGDNGTRSTEAIRS